MIEARHCLRSALLVSGALLTTACNNAAEPERVSSVMISPDTALVAVGSTRQLTAEARTANGKSLPDRQVTWSTTDSTKLRVSQSGLISAVAPGAAQIIAVVDGRADTANVVSRYDDSFNSVGLGDYTELDLSGTRGVWSVGGGVVTATGRANHSLLVRNGSDIADGYVEAKVDRADDAGLVFRVQNVGSYYLLAVRDDAASLPDFHSENIVLYRAENGTFHELLTRNVSWPRGGKLVRAEFQGSTIRIYFDGQLLDSVNDTRYTRGAVGLRHMLHPRAASSTNVFDVFRAGTL